MQAAEDVTVRAGSSDGLKLNLGCGDDIRSGWTNVDIAPRDGAVEMDLEETPWPWSDGSAKVILMDNVFEHLRPGTRPAVLEECHRVLSPDGALIMRLPVPDIGGGWDVTHQQIPSWRWPLHPRYTSRWRVLDMTASRVGPGRALPESLARLLTRFWIVRAIDEVELTVTPQ